MIELPISLILMILLLSIAGGALGGSIISAFIVSHVFKEMNYFKDFKKEYKEFMEKIKKEDDFI